MTDHWLVAMVRTGSELSCVRWWSERGITAYTPTGTHCVVARHPQKKRVTTERAAFGGYAFLADHALGGSYRKADGFLKLLTRNTGAPIFATEADINRIRQRQANGEFDGTSPAVPWSFRVGDVVVISQGPLEGQRAIVVGDGRVEMSLLGRRVITTVEGKNLVMA